VKPLTPERFDVQMTVGKATPDRLHYAQELLGHQLPSGDLAEVFDRALQALIRQLEKRKFAATERPRPGRPGSSENPRYVPAAVKRAVRERDAGQCTYVSATGHRCGARKLLEYDHVEPVARGGKATMSGVRLRCRAHNQFTAEQTFGTEFMRHKRAEARARRAEPAMATAPTPASSDVSAEDRDVIPWLRQLGVPMDRARRAAEFCESMAEASLEDRMRAALRFLAPAHRRLAAPTRD
jgi:hypothetical protein